MTRVSRTAALSVAAALLAACAVGRPAPGAGGPAPRVGVPPRAAAGGPAATPAVAGPDLPPIRAGAAWRAITPEVKPGGPPVRMAGFGPGRDATGVHDDLDARALVIEAGAQSVALVVLDLIGFFHDEVEKIRREAREREPGLSAAYIMVASTHTHAGPDVIGLWTPPGRPIDPGYVALVRDRAAEALAEAWRVRQPARLSIAAARLGRFIHDSRLPIVIDDAAFLVQAETADGRATIASLAVFADHPESLGRGNTLLSSDYPGATRRALEETFGGVAIFASADLGGLMTPLDAEVVDPATKRPVPAGTFERTEILGQEVARALIAAWGARADAPGGGPPVVARAALEARAREFRVPLVNSRFQRGLAEGMIWPRALAPDGTLTSEAGVVTLRVAAAPAGAPPRGTAPTGTVETVAQIACVPGEIYPELVVGGIQDPQDPGADLQGARREPALRSLMSGRHRIVIGLCNDELGYIIPMSQWDEQAPFAYGRDSPQYGEMNSAGPRTAPLLLDLFADLLR